MVVFGGIHEITKELNDLVVFDLKTHKWVQFFQEMQSPSRMKGVSGYFGSQ